VAVIVGVLLASVTLYRPAWDPKYSMAALMAAILFFLLAEIAGLYRPWRGETRERQFFQILFVWAACTAVAAEVAGLSPVRCNGSRSGFVRPPLAGARRPSAVRKTFPMRPWGSVPAPVHVSAA
jgi:hypothetical protein